MYANNTLLPLSIQSSLCVAHQNRPYSGSSSFAVCSSLSSASQSSCSCMPLPVSLLSQRWHMHAKCPFLQQLKHSVLLKLQFSVLYFPPQWKHSSLCLLTSSLWCLPWPIACTVSPIAVGGCRCRAFLCANSHPSMTDSAFSKVSVDLARRQRCRRTSMPQTSRSRSMSSSVSLNSQCWVSCRRVAINVATHSRSRRKQVWNLKYSIITDGLGLR